jgi:hypothetical protein
VRRRIIELDGEPVELTDTYYPVEIARGTPLEGTARIRGGAVTLLAQLGHTGARVVETVTARLPTDEQRDLLQIDATQPVLRLARQTLDAPAAASSRDRTTPSGPGGEHRRGPLRRHRHHRRPRPSGPARHRALYYTDRAKAFARWGRRDDCLRSLLQAEYWHPRRPAPARP